MLAGTTPPGAGQTRCCFWAGNSWGVIAASMEPISHPDAGTGAMSREDTMLALSLIDGIGVKQPLPHQIRRRSVEHPLAKAQVLPPPWPTGDTKVRNW